MFRFKNYEFILFLFSILLTSCAQVVAPGGGKRDEKPPRVVKYQPDSAKLNFNSKIIELTFDEYIELKDINNQLIISPPLESTPEIKVKNKTLTIDLGKEHLKPNTTYSINFGNALQDINESNKKENFSYIFSTGSFIDSLKVKGKVQNAFTHKAEKGMFAMLYSDLSDSAIYKSQPDYFSKTNENGTFLITNIRQGKYKLVVINDLNSNYKYDGDAESIGFTDSIIDPSEKHNILIDVFQEYPKKIFLKKYSHPSYGKFVLVFNEGTDSLRITNLSNKDKGVQEFTDFSKNKDTLTYWIKNYQKDSIKLQVSNGNTVIDTVEFQMIKLADAVKLKRNAFKFELISSPADNQDFDINSAIKLVFSTPVISAIDSDLHVKEDSVLYKERLRFGFNPPSQQIILIKQDSGRTSKKENAGSLTLPVTPILKENTRYHIFIPSKTFTDFFGFSNDSIFIHLKTRELKYYGSLKLKMEIPGTDTLKTNSGQSKKYIVQLLNEKESIVRENIISNSETINYEYLPPDKYKLKIILDENGNGKWDTGNYLKNIQPEHVVFNKEDINIRSNWDAEVEWKLEE